MALWVNCVSLLKEAHFMKLRTKIFTMAIGVCLFLSSSLFALDNKAEESLAKGKRLFADGRYEEAMDNFIDVLVSGNSDQIAEANEYVNLIHFDMGGVVAPKQIPYDEEIAKKQNLGVRSKILFNKTPKQEEQNTTTVKKEEWKEVFTKEPEDTLVEPPSSVPEADPFDYQKKLDEEKKKQEQAAEAANLKQEDKSTEIKNEQNTEPDVITETIVVVRPAEQETIEEEVTFPRGSKSRVRSLQKKKEKKQRQEMIEEVINRLNSNDDVEVYMRGGRIDAIDITSSSVFTGRYTLGNKGNKILEDIYALMILEDAPAYVILPEGSYTDDVTLQNVRQAIAFNSYLIDRGISPAKMNLNMGFNNQEPPEKFSNLAGLSVVFDYEGKARLKSKLQEKNLPPVLSLAVYPFKEITPGADETFVIDFSVMQGASPIKNWNIQIVSHAADDHYYVVKQLSGTGALTYQFFWNGRKRYFGHILPLGKYTIVLRAKDSLGRERVLKRQVILKEMSNKKSKVIIKTEAEVAKEEKIKQEKVAKEAAKKAKAEKEAKALAEWREKEKTLDYKQKRLWNMPGRKKMSGVFEDDVDVTGTKETTISSYSETVTDIAQEPKEESSYSTTSSSYSSESSEDESGQYDFN